MTEPIYQKYRQYGKQEVKLYQYLDPDGYFDYASYKGAQTKTNLRKIEHAGPPKDLIKEISLYINKHVPNVAFGLCHGTRRGDEQRYFREFLDAEVIGTEISDTAGDFPYTIKWDFHNIKDEWIEAIDFIYSNSLDHSYDPTLCLQQWLRCLKVGGICLLQHTKDHSIDLCLEKKEATGALTEENMFDILDQTSSKEDPFRATVKGYKFILLQAVGDTCSLKVVQFCERDYLVIKKHAAFETTLVKEKNNRKIFIDCGGHQATSIEYFRRVYPDSYHYKIYSFEANSNFNSYYEEFDYVEYCNKAVWVEDGEVLFYSNNGGSSSVIKGQAECGGFQKNSTMVSCIDLSRWIKSNFSREDYIILKMDIEGAEYEILEKMLAENTITLIDKLFIEWHCDKTNGEISLQRHLRILKALIDRGVIPYSWCAHEALEAAKNGNHAMLSLDRLSIVATGGRAWQLLAQLNHDYQEILDIVSDAQDGAKANLKTYGQHYNDCRKVFRKEKLANAHKLDLYKVGIHAFGPNEDSSLFSFPDNYQKIIESLGRKIDWKSQNISEHHCDGKSGSAALAIKIANIWDLPELEQLAGHFIPQLEQTVFKSNAFVCAVHAYRNIPSAAERKSSWLWHYDNNPNEEIKLLIYLTDVTELLAPFEYLKHKNSGEIIKMPTSRLGHDHWELPPPMFPNSRIPEMIIEQLLAQGYEKKQVVGPKGTAILFDNNCIHRANTPSEGHRDVVILNIRPSHTRIRPFISRLSTGSWMHKDPVINPEQIAPVLKSPNDSGQLPKPRHELELMGTQNVKYDFT